jgi:hypothetical protein
VNQGGRSGFLLQEGVCLSAYVEVLGHGCRICKVLQEQIAEHCGLCEAMGVGMGQESFIG